LGTGHVHSCGVTTDGQLMCWGCEAEGPEPDQGQCESPEGGIYQQVGGGTGHGCALSTEGTIDCWGCGDDWKWDVGQCEAPAP